MRAIEFIIEDAEVSGGTGTTEHFNGIDVYFEDYGDGEIFVQALANGKELGYVLFAKEGDKLYPQDLEVNERFHRQGIASTMYDYVKSKGYTIRRSPTQTDAGAGFWDKHRPEQNIWEDEQLDEYSQMGWGIRQALEDKGYRWLGQGVDQAAYKEPKTGHILKIFGTHGKEDFSNDHKMFFKWAEFCEKHQDNMFLPRFYGHESFMWNETDYEGKPKPPARYLMIRTEPLKSSGPLGKHLAGLARLFPQYENPDEAVASFETYYKRSAEEVQTQLGQVKYYDLIDTMEKLFEIGESNGWKWDLHGDNIMMRKDGTPVLNDPWVIG